MTPEQPEAPFSQAGNNRRPKTLFWIIGLLALATVVLAVLLLKGPAGPAVSPKMKQMEETVQQIQQLEASIQEKQNQVFSVLNEYKKKTGEDLPEVNIMNLTPEQKGVLEEKIKNEKDVSIKSLLQDILDKNSDIQNLNARVQELETLLPKPHVVEQGENHYQVAMDFLLNEKGLDKAKAMELVERTALFEPIVPGFKIWNFYAEGEYGTFITQGTAPISPNQIQRKVKKDLVDAKDKAIAEKEKLQSDIDEMESRRVELISQLDLLNQEKRSMLTKMSELNEQNEEMQTALNSVFYALGQRRALVEKGILKGGFLRSTKLQKVDPALFDLSLDLRGEPRIVLNALSLQMAGIRQVTLYPGYFRAGVDYQVEFDATNQNATLVFLNPEKFKSERIAVVVE